MGYTTLWRQLSPRQINLAVQTFSLVSIFFEGYDHGVMGGVNASPTYVTEVGIGRPDGTMTDTTHQGGLVSIYYLGCIFGRFAGGWLADCIGRINGLLFGSVFALVGGALQASIQSSDFMIVARVVTGIGTGALTGITPVLVSEISSAEHRGGYLGYVFIANYLGTSVAYWLSFGLSFIDNGYSDFGWRFLLAFQCIPALILATCIKALPDSPRYLASVGLTDEAQDLLIEIDQEYLEILSLFLQIMASWTGITAVTAYSPVLLSQAGYSKIKQNGLAGGFNTIGIIGAIISAQIVDRLGRRKCLMLGSAVLFTVEIAIAGSIYEGSLRHPDKATQYAPGAVAMLFLFNLGYAATWARIKSRSYFLLAGLNLLWIPVVYLFYPETCNRSLESIEALFSTPSPFYWDMERAYCSHGDVLVEWGVEKIDGEKNNNTEGCQSPPHEDQEDVSMH
ncbi:major facilitator superfamily domain-containing protein [Aspergillus sergii]|uniref:Major facilitator superfamily domain-containing protein n=1 Tax=Aspergillus sergii TaxID=1034303 RepID=A0A5N6XJ01_9EURO|nr:major facilitator superfamily domain-containing protein [Aspergillus sergii]